MAAVLALGAEAVASHRSASALWRMLPPHDGAIDVTIPGGGGREKRKGIRVHRSATVTAGCVTRRNGIAITNPARTLRDLHRSLPEPVFRKAVRRALDLRLITEADLGRDAALFQLAAGAQMLFSERRRCIHALVNSQSWSSRVECATASREKGSND